MTRIKAMTLRIPKDLWDFLKDKSKEKEISVSAIINNRLIKYKKSCENKLTSKNTVVS
jgi:hypothetical protein